MICTDLYFDLRLDYQRREIAVAGEFDVATAPCLATAIAGFQRSGPGDITILLDDVTFIDAAGLRAVSRASTGQSEQGMHLSITGASAAVRDVFDAGNLVGLLLAW